MQAVLRLIVLTAAIMATPLWAQTAADTNTDVDAPQTGAIELSAQEVAEAEALPDVFEDQDTWRSFSTRVGTAIRDGKASSSVLGDLRADLVDWRDTFLDRQSTNSDRIASIRRQITALGVAPETGEEDPRVTARRAELSQDLQALSAPATLATEAYTQANGLIGEIDGLIRERQADTFTERTQSPLNPVGWSRTWTVLQSSFRSIDGEVTTAVNNPVRRAEFLNVLPALLVLLAIAVVFVLRGRVWYDRAAQIVTARSRGGRLVVGFILSLGQILIPFIGVVALTIAIILSGMAGRRLTAILDILPSLSLFPIVAHWIAGQLFPNGLEETVHPLSMTPEASGRSHKRLIWMGYALLIFGLAQAYVDVNTLSAIPSAVVMFPFGVFLAWTLYWFGHSIRNSLTEQPEGAERSFRTTLRSFLSKGLMLAAVVGVVFAALGYSNAFNVATMPAAITVYVVAVMMLLQRLSVDLYTLFSKTENAAQDALIPVLMGFLLILVALPILAVIWGAQVTDITELWARFREGFAIGETRISPTSFLWFAAVFVVGYTVTRLVQAALRTTVLPRTKLDPGAQTAMVSGMGYVGIFLAAVIAITTAGIDLSGLAIVAGALSVGIGFGLQNIVSNFISGIILLIERPISQGDWIEVGGQMGYVRDISVRSTRIETFDRTDVIVPNADLISNQVTNWTRGNNVGRVIVPVGVAYGTDTDWIASILKEIAEAHPMVLLNPPPNVVFQGFGADSLDFEIRAILRDVNYVLSVKSDMNHAIAKRFVEEGIEIPFGQRDIWLRNPEALVQKPKTTAKPDETKT